MQVLAVIVGLLVLAAAIVVGLTFSKPDSFRVTRSIDIAAPAQSIFPWIEDFHRWPEWSPYEGRDPAMTRSFEGAPRGKGAVYSWAGNSNVGSGRMEIVDVATPSHVTIRLDFLKPFEAHNVAEFTLAPTGNGTTVSWAMHGPAPFVSKLMQVFMNFDTMIGKDFAAGLANLKAAVEKSA